MGEVEARVKGLKKGSFHLANRGAPVEAPLPSEKMIWYTAGFFDGEGTIHCADGSDGRVRVVKLSVTQSEVNDGERVIRLLRDTWQIGVVNVVTSNRKPNWTPAWRWNIGAYEEVLHLLRALLPALEVKREQAIRAIALMETWPASRPRKASLICAECGTPFERNWGRLARQSDHHFCSQRCCARFTAPQRRRLAQVPCAYCGAIVERRPSAFKRERVFCSLSHASLYQMAHGGQEKRRQKRGTKMVEYPCAFCGAGVLRYPSEILKAGRVYCCKEHSAKAQKGAYSTHCKNGHLLDEANTYVKPNGDRSCRICAARSQAEYRTRKRQTQAQQSWDW